MRSEDVKLPVIQSYHRDDAQLSRLRNASCDQHKSTFRPKWHTVGGWNHTERSGRNLSWEKKPKKLPLVASITVWFQACKTSPLDHFSACFWLASLPPRSQTSEVSHNKMRLQPPPWEWWMSVHSFAVIDPRCLFRFTSAAFCCAQLSEQDAPPLRALYLVPVKLECYCFHLDKQPNLRE